MRAIKLTTYLFIIVIQLITLYQVEMTKRVVDGEMQVLSGVLDVLELMHENDKVAAQATAYLAFGVTEIVTGRYDEPEKQGQRIPGRERTYEPSEGTWVFVPESRPERSDQGGQSGPDTGARYIVLSNPDEAFKEDGWLQVPLQYVGGGEPGYPSSSWGP